MAEVKYLGEVVSTSAIWIRSGPASSYPTVGMLNPKEKIAITEIQGQWVKHSMGGWSIAEDDNTLLIKITDAKTNSVVQPKEPDLNNKSVYAQYTKETNPQVDVYGDEESASLFIKQARGIHGMPYQFMSSVDQRLGASEFGRKYAEKIVDRIPLLLITPGKPKFMKSFSAKEKEDIIRYLKEKGRNPIDDLLNREGRFYDIEFNYKEYYEYVNPMLQMTAKLLNLDSKILDGTPLNRYRWERYSNSQFTSFIGSAETVAFYIDSENQIQQSFSNNTGESMLAGKVNGLSDMGREIQFLLGEAAGYQFDSLSQDTYDSTLKAFSDFSSKYLKMVPESLISRIGSGVLTVATGGKMIFPEIWNDSHYSTSYTINMKLRTPDLDVFSWYMNIAVPLLHLIALVAPQQMGPNAYKSPFLVRGFYKGFFNVDMGIITNMNINKGNEAKWTINGLPTEVDVSFEIKDLYDVLTITKETEMIHLMNNTALMDYLANMCGININKPDVLRQVDIYLNQFANSKGITSRFNRGYNQIEQMLNNKLKDIYETIK